MKISNVLNSANYIVKHNGFNIPPESVNIHKITNDISNKIGTNIMIVFDAFLQDINQVNNIVGYNIEFDKHVTLAELHRNNRKDIIDIFLPNNLHVPCECIRNIKILIDFLN
jgi:DNA polymerase III subunit alpha